MNSSIIDEAHSRMFLQPLSYDVKVRFSRKFSPYNANVRKTGNKLVFSFSPEWKKVSREISIGLVQDLLLRILRKKAEATTNMQLYDSFIKNLHLSAARTKSDGRLLHIFEEVNTKYFDNSIDAPNLRWGIRSRTKLATYDYHTDTINVSTIFRDADDKLVAYLLYHEMLHKKLKFSSSGSRAIHHGREFRQLEKKFENRDEMEKQLQQLARKKTKISWLERII